MAPRKNSKPKETPEEKAARKAVKKVEKKASDLSNIAAMHAIWKLIKTPAVTPETIAFQVVSTCGIDCKYIYRKGGKSELTGKTPLQLAIKAKRLDVARVLIVSHSANVESQAKHGWTSLHAASIDNNLELVRLLVEDGHYDLAKQDMGRHRSASPLQIAMEKRFMPIVDYLYSRCPLPGTLQYAIGTCKDIEMVKYLLSKGCDVNGEYESHTALSRAISCSKEFLVESHTALSRAISCSKEFLEQDAVSLILLLVNSGAELILPLSLAENGGYTNYPLFQFSTRDGQPRADVNLLHLSCQCGHPSVTQLLIELGLPINALDYKGRTPFATAIDSHEWSNASLLINAGADVNVSWQGTTALHLACRCSQSYTVQTLLDHGANVNAISDEGETPLTIITKDLPEYNHIGAAIAVALLQHGADPNIPSAYSRQSPLHGRISVYIARMLIEKGANIDAIDKAGNTPLSALMRLRADGTGPRSHEFNLVLLFISYNANITMVNNNGGSAANYFAELPSCAARSFLDAGHIRLDSRNHGLTPLNQSLDEELGDKTLMCIEYGANTSGIALSCSCRSCPNNTCQQLVDTGAEINDVEAYKTTKTTPLLTALECMNREAALYLLANGADYLTANGRGETPLHLATMNEYIDIVKILVAQGAPINVLDVNGQTPLKRASYLRSEVYRYLLENGGTF